MIDDDDPRNDDGPWALVATADTPIEVLLRRVDVYCLRALAEFRAARAVDPELTEAERAAVLTYLDHVTPWLYERAHADARQAHARLQAEAIAFARARPASPRTH